MIKQQCQCMPNTSQYQLDWIERGELYDEFKRDQLDAGTLEDSIASRTLFDKIYNADKTIVIRDYLQVDGKDSVSRVTVTCANFDHFLGARLSARGNAPH